MARPSVKDQRERELVEAAIRCIARKGLQATTITDVSEEAGLSRGIINFYFASKENLIEASLIRLLEGFTERAVREAEKAQPKGADAMFEAYWQAHFSPEICNQKRMNVWLEYAGAATSHKALAKAFANYRAQWVKHVADYAAAAKKQSFAKQSTQHFALLGGLWMQCALEGVADHRAAAAAQWMDALKPAAAPATVAAQPQPAKPREVAKPAAAAPVAAKPAPAPKKKPAPDVLPGQLDFGDLFAVGKR